MTEAERIVLGMIPNEISASIARYAGENPDAQVYYVMMQSRKTGSLGGTGAVTYAKGGGEFASLWMASIATLIYTIAQSMSEAEGIEMRDALPSFLAGIMFGLKRMNSEGGPEGFRARIFNQDLGEET